MKKIMPFKEVYQNIACHTQFLTNTITHQIFPPSSASIAAQSLRAGDIYIIEPHAFLGKHIRSTVPLGMQALFSYQAPIIRSLLEELRCFNDHNVSKLFSHFIYKEVKEMALLQRPLETVVVFIPCTKTRIRTHGFWQFHTIYMYMARISAKTGITVAPPDTLHVVSGNKKEPSCTVSKAHAPLIHGKYCILVDDIIVSCRTLSGARDALFLAGASHISCLAIAT
ncbi:MAG TPA: phosphoribosyltransferase [Candidatus Paceibacterota bacterium]|nr:phosphoribosyltransferase [Candidatus Paceibacterota bacterium]